MIVRKSRRGSKSKVVRESVKEMIVRERDRERHR